MIYKDSVHTEEEPLEQRSVLELIKAGYTVDLLLEYNYDSNGNPQYFLYAKYRNHLRPIYTQRESHKNYASLERAVEWGKRLGFKHVSLEIDYSDFQDLDD